MAEERRNGSNSVGGNGRKIKTVRMTFFISTVATIHTKTLTSLGSTSLRIDGNTSLSALSESALYESAPALPIFARFATHRPDNRSTTMTDSSDGVAIPIYFSSVFATPTSWYSHDTGVMHMIPDPSITSPLVEENPESGDSDYIISENDVSWSATYPFMVALTAVR